MFLNSTRVSEYTEKDKIATVIISVVVLTSAVGMIAYVLLAPTGPGVVFVGTLSLVLFTMGTVRIYSLLQHESEKSEKSEKLRRINPSTCPDYWTRVGGGCDAKCKPVFESADGSKYYLKCTGVGSCQASESTQMNLAGLSSCPSEGNPRDFAWTEIDNQCRAKGDVV
jgi:hypothetical protein